MKLKSLGTLLLNITFCLAATSDVGVVNAQGTTESGIPLNAPWKRTIYDLAKTNLIAFAGNLLHFRSNH